jgi:hypothetical protein
MAIRFTEYRDEKQMSLEQDWERVLDVWIRVKDALPNPEMQLFESIYEMRKLDRGIDHPLRRLLDSDKYGSKIRTYGSTSNGFGKHPFKWDNKVWLLIRVKTSIESE